MGVLLLDLLQLQLLLGLQLSLLLRLLCLKLLHLLRLQLGRLLLHRQKRLLQSLLLRLRLLRLLLRIVERILPSGTLQRPLEDGRRQVGLPPRQPSASVWPHAWQVARQESLGLVGEDVDLPGRDRVAGGVSAEGAMPIPMRCRSPEWWRGRVGTHRICTASR